MSKAVLTLVYIRECKDLNHFGSVVVLEGGEHSPLV